MQMIIFLSTELLNAYCYRSASLWKLYANTHRQLDHFHRPQSLWRFTAHAAIKYNVYSFDFLLFCLFFEYFFRPKWKQIRFFNSFFFLFSFNFLKLKRKMKSKRTNCMVEIRNFQFISVTRFSFNDTSLRIRHNWCDNTDALNIFRFVFLLNKWIKTKNIKK